MGQSTPINIPRWLAVLLVLVGVALFIARGPGLMMSPVLNGDSRLVTVAARAWVHGENPYDTRVISQTWAAAGGARELDQSWRGAQAFVYPPSGYVLAAPIGMLPPELARHCWNTLSVLLFLASLVGLVRLAGMPLRSTWGLTAFGVGLAMGPAHTNIWLGQTTIFVFAAVIGSMILRERGRPWLAGVVLGVACAIKPQTGLVFVGYELGRGRWRIVFAAAWVFAMLMLAGVARTWFVGFDGFGAWMANSRELLEHDANPIGPGIFAYRLIDLASPIAVLIGDAPRARVMAFVAMALASAAYALVDWRRGGAKGEGRPELLSAGAVSVVMLLVCYHRFYDAVFVLIPLMLAISQVRSGDRRGWITLALTLPFFAPGASMLAIAAERHIIPSALAEKLWWQVGIVQHQTWTLCLLLIWMVWLRSRWSSQSAAAPVSS